MTLVPAAIAALLVLSAAGALPALWSVGIRWVSLPLLPLTGSVVAAMAATSFLAVGLTFMTWFVGLSLLLAAAVGAHWWVQPDRRPWRRPDGGANRPGMGHLVTGLVGLVGTVGACAWGLRALATPTVGFDARALWLMRAGWFLQPHHQLLDKMKVPDVGLFQSAYPPLVSASTSAAWSITGNHSLRLGVVVVAVLNVCALSVAALALVEAGRRFAVHVSPPRAPRAPRALRSPRATHVRRAAHRRSTGRVTVWTILPPVVGVTSAILVVFIAFGITEPFMTNGYADPIWSLAGVGAVAYGLQLQEGVSDRSVAFILILVAGLSKNEGVANAVPLVVLVAGRAAIARWRGERRRGWWRPVAVGTGVLVAVSAWPELMKAIHARGATTTLSLTGHLWARTTASYHGMAPYLHVLVLALLIAVVGGVVLSRVRRTGGLGNDLWAWAAVAGGLVTVGGAFVFGSGAITPWLETTVHRVTEFDALAGWWIVAMWGVAASGAPALMRRRSEDASSSAGPEDDQPVEIGSVEVAEAAGTR